MKQKYRTAIVTPLGIIYSKFFEMIQIELDTVHEGYTKIIEALNKNELKIATFTDENGNPVIIPNYLLKQSYIKIEKL